jgi:hypothetical protein
VSFEAFIRVYSDALGLQRRTFRLAVKAEFDRLVSPRWTTTAAVAPCAATCFHPQGFPVEGRVGARRDDGATLVQASPLVDLEGGPASGGLDQLSGAPAAAAARVLPRELVPRFVGRVQAKLLLLPPAFSMEHDWNIMVRRASSPRHPRPWALAQGPDDPRMMRLEFLGPRFGNLDEKRPIFCGRGGPEISKRMAHTIGFPAQELCPPTGVGSGPRDRTRRHSATRSARRSPSPSSSAGGRCRAPSLPSPASTHPYAHTPRTHPPPTPHPHISRRGT